MLPLGSGRFFLPGFSFHSSIPPSSLSLSLSLSLLFLSADYYFVSSLSPTGTRSHCCTARRARTNDTVEAAGRGAGRVLLGRLVCIALFIFEVVPYYVWYSYGLGRGGEEVTSTQRER